MNTLIDLRQGAGLEAGGQARVADAPPTTAIQFLPIRHFRNQRCIRLCSAPTVIERRYDGRRFDANGLVITAVHWQ